MKIKFKLFKACFTKYRPCSLYFKNMYLLFLLVLIPILGTVFLGVRFYQNLEETENRAYNEEIAADILNETGNILQEARKLLVSFSFHTDVQMFLYDSDFSREQYRIDLIKERILIQVVSREYLQEVYIYNPNSGYIINKTGVILYRDLEDRQALESYLEDGKELLIAESTAKGYPAKVLCINYEMSLGKNLNGIFVMTIDVRKLLKFLDIDESVEFFVVNEDEIILASDSEFLSLGVEQIGWYDKAEENGSKGDYYILVQEDEKSGMQIVMRTRLEDSPKEQNYIRFFISTLILLIVCMTFLMVIIISGIIFRPIGTITNAVKGYEDIFVNEAGGGFLKQNEVDYILDVIQKAVRDRKGIEEELGNRISLLRKAQAVALQSQINPHFLNNTLESVNWIAMKQLGDENEISEVVAALSRMLRVSLENTDVVVPIQREVEHCQYYLKIQKNRYGDKFRIKWEIEEEVYSCKIVKIVLQPLIENAIHHGIKPLSRPGTVVIKGKIVNDMVEITVMDDGLGMSGERLEEVLSGVRKEEIRESQHIGLANVNQRLKLFFGEGYHLCIESQENHGTAVTVRIPCIR